MKEEGKKVVLVFVLTTLLKCLKSKESVNCKSKVRAGTQKSFSNKVIFTLRFLPRPGHVNFCFDGCAELEK